MRVPNGAHAGLCDANGNDVRGRLIEVAGHRTHVVEAGSGSCVLLLHGYGDSASSWRRVFPALARNHRVIAIDLPGFGLSGAPNGGTDLIDHYSAFFPELSEHLQVERASVVGHSLGGAVALRIALEQPEAVDNLALIAPAGLGDSPPWWWHAIAGTYVNWQAMLRLPNPLAKNIIRTTMRSFLRQTLVYDTRQLEHLIEEFVEKHAGRKQLAALIEAGRSLIKGYDGSLLERARHELDAPVSIIWGTEDRLADPAHAQTFAAAVPHADVHLLERCGHYPQMEFPSHVNDLLQEVLKRRRPRRRRLRAAA